MKTTREQELVRRLELVDADIPMDDGEVEATLREFGLKPSEVRLEAQQALARLRKEHPAVGRNSMKRRAVVAVAAGAIALLIFLLLRTEKPAPGATASQAAPSTLQRRTSETRFALEEWQSSGKTEEELAMPGGTPALKTPSTEADGHLEVYVSSGDEPRPNARVRVYLRGPRDPTTANSEWRFAGGGTTTSQGTLRIPARFGSYLVAVRAEGFAAARREVVRPVGEALTQLRVSLGAGQSLHGRTLQKGSHAEVPQVEVALVRLSRNAQGGGDSPAEETVYGTSDARGRFEIAGLELGPYELRASAPGHAVLEREVMIPRTDELALELVAAATVSGRVIDSKGKGAPSAEVEFVGGTSGARVIRVTAGPSGDFAAELAAGTYRAGAKAEGEVGSAEHELMLIAGRTLDNVVIRLGQGGSITGLVKAKTTGAPISDAYVALSPFAGDGDLGRAYTAVDGTFAIRPLVTGVYDVEAYAEGFSPLIRRGVTLFSGQEFPLVLELDGTGAVEGRVHDSAGQPVAGAVVQGGRLQGGPFIWGSAGQVRTQPDGSFRLSGLEVGRVRITVGRTPDAWLVRELVDIREGAVTKVDLTLDELGTVMGTVTLKRGAPLDGDALVLAIPQATYVTGADRREARVERNGAYTLKLPPGRYSLRAARADGNHFVAPIGPATVVEAGKTVRQDLELGESGESYLSGVVLEPSGQPSAGAWVGVSGPPVVTGSRFRGAVQADESGRFQLVRRVMAPPAVLTVSARNQGRTAIVEGVAAGKTELSVQLVPGGALTLRVDSAKPPKSVRVLAETTDDRLMPYLSGDPREMAGQTLRFENLPAGTNRVTVVDAESGATGTVDVLIPSGDEAKGSVRLNPPASIGGVITANGQPVSGAVVRLDGEVPGAFNGGWRPTSATGAFLLSPVEPGHHRLSVILAGFETLEREVTVEPGQSLDLGAVRLSKVQ